MFEKLDEYLVKIYMNNKFNNDFIVFKRNAKNNYIIKGFIDSNDAFMLYRKNNELGLKANNGNYTFIYSREKFINSEIFKNLIDNDYEYDEEELIEKYKDVDYVYVGEYDKQTGTGQNISFLVNKSSYLVTDYYRQYEDNNNVLASYDKDLLNSEALSKLRMENPIIPNFNIASQKKDNIIVLVSNNLHENFFIKENMKETNNLFLRKSIVKKMANEAVEADRKSYTIIKDFDECAEKLNDSLKQLFNNNLDAR